MVDSMPPAPPGQPVGLELPNADATDALGARIGGWIAASHTPLIIYLSGELGAGKTSLARALLRALGVTGRIKSPSYALVEPYEIDLPAATGFRDHLRLYCYHFDFYRFNDPREWLDAGFRDYLDGSSLCLVEWPEKAALAGHLPDPDLHITLAASGAGRAARLRATSPKGQLCLAAVVSSQQA